MSELTNDMSGGAPFISRATDPVVSNVATPADFAAQFPTPLDPTEVLQLAEEANLYKWIPVKRTALQAETWREMTSLVWTSGTTYIAFADGACPEEYQHNGSNTTVTLKNAGVKKSLTLSDILHSAAVAALPMGAINRLLGPAVGGQGLPGAGDVQSEVMGAIADLKAKEIALGTVLVINGSDRLLVRGNSSTNSLEFDGVEVLLVSGSGVNVPTSFTGTFSAIGYDRFISETPVRPTVVMGHPAALQELQAGYFQLGFQASQQVMFTDGNRITPGYNFANSVNTAVGTLALVGDINFTRTNTGGSTFQSALYGIRATHNGEKLMYRPVQIPLAYKDLAPGCTSIAFEIFEKSALIIKTKPFHSNWTGIFTGRIVSTVSVVGV